MSYKRTSRWSLPTEVTNVLDQDGTPLPTAISANMTQEQLEIYVLHLRVLEITSILRLPDSILLKQPELKRSRRAASLDPEYNAAGRRTNTRLQRRRHALEVERHASIERIVETLPAYRTPIDYRRPTRAFDRLLIPSSEFPCINFIGQILGPRGHSLKDLQERSGATIALRGRGSIKQGRGTTRRLGLGRCNDDSNQPLHAVISADSTDKIQEAKRLLQQVIDDAICSPEEQNERKRKQLRGLAIMNGTFRDDEGRQRISALTTTQTSICKPQIHGNTHFDQQTGSANDRFEEEYKRLMEDIQGP